MSEPRASIEIDLGFGDLAIGNRAVEKDREKVAKYLKEVATLLDKTGGKLDGQDVRDLVNAILKGDHSQ